VKGDGVNREGRRSEGRREGRRSEGRSEGRRSEGIGMVDCDGRRKGCICAYEQKGSSKCGT
jgi:hypothetical protein